MKFVFDEARSSEAAAFLLARRHGKMGYLKLLKLLYLADRKSLIETGFPITGDTLSAMDKGPVLSALYDRFKGSVSGGDAYRRLIRPGDEGGVQLVGALPPCRHLSAYDQRVLGEVDAVYGHFTGEQLVEILHREAPEWKAPPSGSSERIPPEAVLRAGGRSDLEVASIAEEADYYYAVESRRRSA